MLKELVDRLVNLGRETQAARVLQVASDPHRYWIEHDAQLTEHAVPPPVRGHRVLTLEDLIAAAKSSFAVKPVVWHNEKGAVLVLDDDTRRDRVCFDLHASVPFVALQQLDAAAAKFSPKELAMFLRTTLASCIYNRDLVKLLRKLTWKTSSETRTVSGPGRESLGRDVEAELQTPDVPLPEELDIELPLYTNVGEDNLWPVRCLLEPDIPSQRFAFGPIPGELEKAAQFHQANIRERLEQAHSGVPNFSGVP
jgi:hypothetical protein